MAESKGIQQVPSQRRGNLGLDAPIERFPGGEGQDMPVATQPGPTGRGAAQIHPEIVGPELLAIDIDLVNPKEKVPLGRLQEILLAARSRFARQFGGGIGVVDFALDFSFHAFVIPPRRLPELPCG